MRAVGPGGQIALNFRSWSGTDPFVLPLGALMRGMFRLPVLGKWLLRHRLPTRLAWQANRLDPHQVIGPFRDRLSDVVVWRNSGPQRAAVGCRRRQPRVVHGINRNHWWLVATVK